MNVRAPLLLLVSVPVVAVAAEALPIDPKLAGATAPAGVKVKGATVEQVWSWGEGDGVEGYGVFSATEKKTKDGRVSDRFLYVQLLRGKPGALKEVRLVQDGTRDCADADLQAAFVEDSIRVTDVDGDGEVELSFAYDLNCTTDVSPATRKLLVLEGAGKHILRGEAQVELGEGEKAGGGFAPEGFKEEPKLEAFARARWEALLTGK